MTHPQVITSLEAELAGIEIEIEGCKDGLTDPLMKERDVKTNKAHIEKCEALAKQYKSAIRVLNLFDEVSIENI